MTNDTATLDKTQDLNDWYMDDHGYVHGGFNLETPLFMEAKAERNARLDEQAKLEKEEVSEPSDVVDHAEIIKQNLQLFRDALSPENSVIQYDSSPRHEQTSFLRKIRYFFSDFWYELKKPFTV